MSLKFLDLKAKNLWNEYWFQPSPLFNLGFCRIIIVAYQLYHVISRGYLEKLTSIADLPTIQYQPLPIFSILNFPFFGSNPPSDLFLSIIYWLIIASGILALVGFKTNLSLLVFAVTNLYAQTYIYSFGRFHHPGALILISLFLLALSPSGNLLSLQDLKQRIDRNLKRKSFNQLNVLLPSSLFSKWPLLTIQWLFAFVYLSAAVNKLTPNGSPSLDWLNGYTLQYYLMSDGLTWGSEIGVWLGQFHVLAIIFSWFAVLFEGTFFLTVLFPRTVWFFIPLGIMFHLGIYLCQRAPFFQYLPLYAVFIPWAAVIKSISNRFQWSAPAKKAEIFYDGLCPICIRSMTILSYFDWFQRLTYSDLEVRWPYLSEKHPEISLDDCLQEMHLLKPDGSVSKGFYAFRDIVGYIPTLWFLLPFMHLPGAAAIGSYIYKLVASNRSRFERCSFDVCSVNLKKKKT